MRALVTVLEAVGRRGKRLVDDWPAYDAPQANEVKTRTIYSGLTNGTERNNMLGGNYSRPDHELPSNEGYQSVGEIIALGPEVSTLSLGDLVFIGAHTGAARSPAGHVEFVTIAEDDLVLKLPSDVDPVHAALFGMGGVAMRSCRNADLRMGDRLLIVGGAGCIGQMAAQIATVMGARVTVCDVAGRRLDLARSIGAAESVVDVSGDGWDRHIGEGSYDAVIDFAGVPGMEDQLIMSVRPRGRVILVAGRWEVNYTFRSGQGQEITIKQNSHFDRDDLRNLCRLVSRGLVEIGPLIQDVVPVNEAPRIYATLRDDSSQLMGAVFRW